MMHSQGWEATASMHSTQYVYKSMIPHAANICACAETWAALGLTATHMTRALCCGSNCSQAALASPPLPAESSVLPRAEACSQG